MIKLVDLLDGTSRNPFTGELQEGLIKTVELKKAMMILLKAFRDKSDPDNKGYVWLRRVDVDPENITIPVEVGYPRPPATNKYVESQIAKLLQLINNLGYFVNGYFEPGVKGYQPYTPSKFRNFITNDQPSDFLLLLHPKYGEEVKKLPAVLYHVTPTKYVPKILKIGLKPATQSKKSYHPERVYLATTAAAADNIAEQLEEFSPGVRHSMLKIQTNKLPEGLKFYEDPHFDDGIYTHGNIPPNAISVT